MIVRKAHGILQYEKQNSLYSGITRRLHPVSSAGVLQLLPSPCKGKDPSSQLLSFLDPLLNS